MHRTSIFFLNVTSFIRAYSWHAYDPERCDQYKLQKNRLPNLQYVTTKYKIWPVLEEINEATGNLDSLFGCEYALEKIWFNQHPVNCSRAKFLIINDWYDGGFGSQMHVMGAALGLALNFGRVLLQIPVAHAKLQWQVNSTFCLFGNSKKNLECYYEPWSSCSVFDALGPDAITMLGRNKVKYFNISSSEYQLLASKEEKNIFRAIKLVSSKNFERTAMIDEYSELFHKFIPISLLKLVRCSPMFPNFHYYWWRAISVMYLLRPNNRTLNWMSEQRNSNAYRLPPPHVYVDSPMIGVYIRKGDKHLEMEDISLTAYKNATKIVYDKYFARLKKFLNITTAPSLFLATEDSRVLKDMIEWAEKEGWELYYTNLFNRTGLSAEMTAEQKKQMGYEVHHELEYLSMLLNIDYLLRCSAWVCALRSNFCRIIDELRATVGGKLHAPYADLSIETCVKPPCIGKGIRNFDWR